MASETKKLGDNLPSTEMGSQDRARPGMKMVTFPDRDFPTPVDNESGLPKEQKGMGKNFYDGGAGENFGISKRPVLRKKGGKVTCKAKGGTVRGCGCAVKGKTKGRMV